MTSRPPFPILLFAQLVHRLRHTNARYDFIAYQCRHTQRRTHHAQRRARRVGLSIDTDKARAAFQQCGPEAHVVASDSEVRSVWESPSPSPVWTDEDADVPYVSALEDESEGQVEDAAPEVLVEGGPLASRPRTDGTSPALSPLDLALRTLDDDDDMALPPPGAPSWKTTPLPNSESDLETGSVGTAPSLKVVRMYDPVRRGVGRGVMRTVRASNASLSMVVPVDAVPYYVTGLGIAVPTRPLKRKHDVDVDAIHDIYAFRDRHSGARWNALQVLG